MSNDLEKTSSTSLEKKASNSSPRPASFTDRVDPNYYNEELDEPREEESLHRGLKARQISMIAVRLPLRLHFQLLLTFGL